MSVADRSLDYMGPGFADRAGPLLQAILNALTADLDEVDELASGADGWGSAFNLQRTKAPAWLGQLAGVRVAAGTLEQQRAVVASRGPGRGTARAIAAAAKSTLTGTRLVTLTERAGGDPYKLIVQVFRPQMPDETATRAAITAALPAGLRARWELVVLTGQSWQQLRTSGETWSSLRTQTFDDVRSRIPNG